LNRQDAKKSKEVNEPPRWREKQGNIEPPRRQEKQDKMEMKDQNLKIQTSKAIRPDTRPAVLLLILLASWRFD